MTKEADLAIWKTLDSVRQRTLKAAYDLDQLKERFERDMRAEGHYGRPPASEWRWFFLWSVSPRDSHPDFILAKYLIEKKTFTSQKNLFAEAERVLRDIVKLGLLETRKRRTSEGLSSPQYRMTLLGRRVVRTATGEVREKPLPVGTLREYHWRALELILGAGDAGLADGGHSCYGNISWKTWLRLRDYKAGALVETRGGKWLWDKRTVYVDEQKRVREYVPQSEYRLYITEFGREFYKREQDHYREMYPDEEKTFHD
jgi:hypothetical protein